MRLDGEFYFKRSKVNGEEYLQIWQRVKDGKDVYLLSCGNAEKVYKKYKGEQ